MVSSGKSVKVQSIGADLGVAHVVEGSVRRAGNRVRVGVQLFDTGTGRHLWAERYDGDLSDIFALQDEITHQIVAALKVELTLGERARIAKRYTDNAHLTAWHTDERESAELPEGWGLNVSLARTLTRRGNDNALCQKEI